MSQIKLPKGKEPRFHTICLTYVDLWIDFQSWTSGIELYLLYPSQALSSIDDILRRCKVPIIVGGTNYYIDSILWDTLTSCPHIEADKLVTDHRRILSNSQLINQWQTYEATALPLMKREEFAEEEASYSEPVEPSAASVAVDDVIRLSDAIKMLVFKFEECLRNVADQFDITAPAYLRTFYQLPGFGAVSDGADNQSLPEIWKNLPEPKHFNFVEAELALLRSYLCSCLQQINNLLADSGHEDRFITRLCREFISKCWDEGAVRTAVINQDLPSSTDFSKLLKKICDLNSSPNLLPKCHEALCNLYQNLVEITELRRQRLKLLRIMDDHSLLEYTNDELYEELKLVDSEATKSIHPNNRRKVIRALQIYFQNGMSYSEFIEAQHNQEGGNGSFAPMRFPDTCVLWLTSDQTVLDQRLDKRVDEMMRNGLIEELEKFHEQYNLDRLKHNIVADYTKGIFQSIGLKEFHKYLMLSAAEKISPGGKLELSNGIKQLKLATRRYAKVQYRQVLNTYIRIPPEKTVPPVFELDCTYLEQWKEKVERIAFDIVDAYLRGENLKNFKHAPVPIEEPDAGRFQDGKFFCDVCQRMLIGRYQYLAHYSSKGHRKQLYQTKVRELQKKIAGMGPAIVKEPDDSLEDDEILNLCSLGI